LLIGRNKRENTPGAVGMSIGSADAYAEFPTKTKRCATTGTYVKPGKTKPVGNSGKNNPGKLFKGRPGQNDGDQERNTGETANLGGFAAAVTGASFEQSLSSIENDGYLKVSVKICNRNSDTNNAAPLDWKLQTPNGNRIDMTITGAPTLPFGTLVGGGGTGGRRVLPGRCPEGRFLRRVQAAVRSVRR
jgi:hypothetical protein